MMKKKTLKGDESHLQFEAFQGNYSQMNIGCIKSSKGGVEEQGGGNGKWKSRKETILSDLQPSLATGGQHSCDMHKNRTTPSST